MPLDRPFHDLKHSVMAEFERAYLQRCLEEAGMNVSKASRISGLSRKHLRTLMLKYGVLVRRELVLEDSIQAEDATGPIDRPSMIDLDVERADRRGEVELGDDAVIARAAGQ